MSDRLFRVPVEIVTVGAAVDDDGVGVYYARVRRGEWPEPIADLYIRDGRFVALVYYKNAAPLVVRLRIFPMESLAA